LASQAARYLAVRRVTQDNRGKKTAGIDGKTALNPQERLALVQKLARKVTPQPTRRVWRPKPGKSERRPLGIPVIADRAHQALIKLSLEPEWEAKFEPNSYGFRPGRSCHDAIEAIHKAINSKNVYVLDADISGCFDNISHTALLQKLNAPPTTRRIIRAWLKAGVLDKEVFTPTEKGTPQGGVISPLLANIALYGMEEEIKTRLFKDLIDDHKERRQYKWSRKHLRRSLSIIRYADDFVILHESLHIIQKAKEYVTEWLQGIGLELKDSKTRTSHTLHEVGDQKAGFDFLGFNIRQYAVSQNATKGGYGFKTLIKPSKKALKTHLKAIKTTLGKLRGTTQLAVIKDLNPIIKGWSRYYSTSIARKTFEKADHEVHRKLWRWAKFRHSHKGEKWIRRKYFRQHGGSSGAFKPTTENSSCSTVTTASGVTPK
jgi:RNA-directed DNA polymerase